MRFIFATFDYRKSKYMNTAQKSKRPMEFDKQDLDKKTLLGLYEAMLKPRMIEEKMLV